MRELVVKYLSKGISRRSIVTGLTQAGLTMTAAQSVLSSVSTVSQAQVGVGPTWAWLTVLTELRTDWAAVMVRPAWVRPVTILRREIPFDKYLTTSSLMIVSLTA